jgi:DNA polymerase elongation subunit (family B)
MAQQLFLLASAIGIKLSVSYSEQGLYTFATTNGNCEETTVTQNDTIDTANTNTKYVYDLETASGRFGVGVGSIVCFNTDSVFIDFNVKERFGVTDKNELIDKTIELAMDAGSKFTTECLKAPHDLEYEKTFFPFILLSKKRYVGNLYTNNSKSFKQKSMGIVLKRRDNAQVVKKVYGGIIDVLLNELDTAKSISFLNECLDELVKGRCPMKDLIITKTLRGHYKNINSIAHAALAKRMYSRDPGSAPVVNDRVPYVFIKVNVSKEKKKKLLQADKVEDPDFVVANKLKIDYEHYITNQIMKPVLDLYALIVEKLPKSRLSLKKLEETENALLRKDELDPNKVKVKMQKLRVDEVKRILFDPYLRKLENPSQITDFFTLINS